MREIQTIIAIVNKAPNKVERLEARVTQFQRTFKTVIRLNKSRTNKIVNLVERSLRSLGQEDILKDQVD